jgi:hypothetical protein
MLVASVFVLLTAVSPAQEPPGWVPLGNLPNATMTRDIVEVPGTSILVACGKSGGWTEPEVWRSTNGGASWTGVLDAGGATNADTLLQLARDSLSGRIWTVVSGRSGANTLYYSTNDGANWTGVSGPSPNPAVGGRCIEVYGDYLYFGGSIGSPYSITLYRLHQTNLTWEAAATYPECDAITQLKVHSGKPFVFCRDMDEAKVRVFTYAPSDLDARAIYVGKAEVSQPGSSR